MPVICLARFYQLEDNAQAQVIHYLSLLEVLDELLGSSLSRRWEVSGALDLLYPYLRYEQCTGEYLAGAKLAAICYSK